MFTSDVGDNLILQTDSYKPSHWKQLPPGTTTLRSYLEPRGGPYARVVAFGALNIFIDKLFGRPITRYMIDEADEVIGEHIGPGIFNRKGWEHILNKHGGWLPLRIRAVPEGTVVPIKNALITMENTDPVVPWLTNYIETAFYPWYPYTVSTLSHSCRQIILKYLKQTGDPSLIDFKLHDFGFRGTTDPFVGWQAAIGGLAHLVHFKGTDTMGPALMAARRYYGCRMAGFSIPAAEHSTITSWGKQHEVDAYRNELQQFPEGLVAVVSDSYDIYHACETLWGGVLRDEVLNRNGVLVIRPDSGNPVEVVLRCIEILGNKFGFTVNEKGYKVLHPKVRMIQGDGVDPVSIDMILAVLAINGWSADNIAFGMGGALLQKVNRDTMKFATKCMSVVTNGIEVPVFKSPVTDPGKASKSGNLTLYRTSYGHYYTAEAGGSPSGTDVLQTFYENGDRPYRDNLDAIRERALATTPLHRDDCRAKDDDDEARCTCGN
jgi:nicotinamide phosphoribosyltransferase